MCVRECVYMCVRTKYEPGKGKPVGKDSTLFREIVYFGLCFIC